MPKLFKPTAAIFLFVALAYLFCAPTTVQNLDSGEMVANSYGLFVIHPPGYPLFTWLMFLVTHFPLSTAFFRASAFTTLCSLATLWLIYRIGTQKNSTPANWGGIAMTIALALTPVYWRYSILPDVFMLHLLFCASLSYVYLEWPVSSKRIWVLSLLFGLGAANHQTILFCLPMLLHAAWQIRPLKRVALPLATGAFVTVLLYLSLFLLHTDSLNSWGRLQTLGDLWAHFLRKDFGTFQISGHQESQFTFGPLALFAIALLKANALALLFIPIGLLVVRARNKRIWTIGLCAALSVFAIIPFANLDDLNTIERFFLMPTILCVILGAALWREANISSRAICGAVIAVTIGTSFFNTLPVLKSLNYSHDTIIEDYAQNLLRMVANEPKAILLTQGDARLFATRYVQVVQALSPQTIAIPVGMAFDHNQLDKIKLAHPDFKVDADWNEGANARSIPDHLLMPNLSNYTVLTDLRVNYPNMQTVFMGVGRILRPGQGDRVDTTSLALIKRRTLMTEPASVEPVERKEYYAEYAFPYLKLGLKAKDPKEQLAYFQQALDVVPYCLPALGNICALNEKINGQTDTECRQRLDAMKATEFNYYH